MIWYDMIWYDMGCLPLDLFILFNDFLQFHFPNWHTWCFQFPQSETMILIINMSLYFQHPFVTAVSSTKPLKDLYNLVKAEVVETLEDLPEDLPVCDDLTRNHKNRAYKRSTSWFCPWFWRNVCNADATDLASVLMWGIHPPENIQNGGRPGREYLS
jgi:hypothetical protein